MRPALATKRGINSASASGGFEASGPAKARRRPALKQNELRAWPAAGVCARPSPKKSARQSNAAFTLLEVMFAMAIFSVAIFSILELSTRSLKTAQSLQRQFAEPAMIAAEYAAQTELEEGGDSGDFGDAYPGATWESIVEEVLDDTGQGTGLYNVQIFVRQNTGRGVAVSGLEILLFRPQGGGPGGGIGRRNLGGGGLGGGRLGGR